MLLRILFAALLLDITYARRYQCPTNLKMRSCLCLESSMGLDIFCEYSPLHEVREVLANVAKTNQTAHYLTLKDIQMTNLPSNLLAGLDVENIVVLRCNLFSVDQNAFADVADSLEWLILPYNALERIPSQALQKLSSLTYLNMKFNRLKVLHAEAFKGLSSLIRLSLYGNRIKSIDDSAFVGIGSDFRELRLDVNELTTVPSGQLRDLGSLEFLELQGNRITALQPEEFADMASEESLTHLNLANNAIRHLPHRAFASLKKLQVLDLSQNVIQSMHFSSFQGTEDSLRYLKLGDNRLDAIPSASLKNMTALQILDLSGNSICNVHKDDFLPYGKSLMAVHLQKNSLTYVDPESFVSLVTLKTLWLQSNQLNSAPYEIYASILDTIEMFYIHDNPLHCDCNISWLSYWMKGTTLRGTRSTIVMANYTKCFSPKEHANKRIAEIPMNQFVCGNSTWKPSEPGCNRINNSPQRLSSGGFMTLLQITFTYFLTGIATRLF